MCERGHRGGGGSAGRAPSSARSAGRPGGDAATPRGVPRGSRPVPDDSVGRSASRESSTVHDLTRPPLEVRGGFVLSRRSCGRLRAHRGARRRRLGPGASSCATIPRSPADRAFRTGVGPIVLSDSGDTLNPLTERTCEAVSPRRVSGCPGAWACGVRPPCWWVRPSAAGIFRVPSAVAGDVGTVGARSLFFGWPERWSRCSAHSPWPSWPSCSPAREGSTYSCGRAYGPLPAFLFGWTELLVIRPSALGAIAVLFAEYFAEFAPIGDGWGPGGGGLGHRRRWQPRISARSAGEPPSRTRSTVAKVVALVGLALLAFALGDPAEGAFAQPIQLSPTSWSGFGIALVAVLWAYDGWADLTFLGGEVRDPARGPASRFAGRNRSDRRHLSDRERRVSVRSRPAGYGRSPAGGRRRGSQRLRRLRGCAGRCDGDAVRLRSPERGNHDRAAHLLSRWPTTVCSSVRSRQYIGPTTLLGQRSRLAAALGIA